MKKIKIKKFFQLLLTIGFFIPLVSYAAIYTQGWHPENYADTNLPTGSIVDIIHNVMQWILIIFGLISVIGFVISGILYLTAAGNETQIESAKKAMKWSIIGVIVGLLGLIILFAVTTALDPFFSGGLF